MRTIKELLQLLLDRFNSDDMLDGLCNTTYHLEDEGIILNSEANHLMLYFDQNKPTNTGIIYWWEMFDKTPRIQWLKEQIKLLSK